MSRQAGDFSSQRGRLGCSSQPPRVSPPRSEVKPLSPRRYVILGEHPREARVRRPTLDGGARLRWAAREKQHWSGVFREVRFTPSHSFDDLEVFLGRVKKHVTEWLVKEVAKKGPLKVKVTIEIDVTRGDEEGVLPKSLTSGAFSAAKDTLLPITRASEVAPQVTAMIDEIPSCDPRVNEKCRESPRQGDRAHLETRSRFLCRRLCQ